MDIAGRKLTARQADVLRVVIEETRRTGYCPSRREVAEQIGCTHQNVTRILLDLKTRGLIAWNNCAARSLSVHDDGESQSQTEQFVSCVRAAIPSGRRSAKETARDIRLPESFVTAAMHLFKSWKEIEK